ncbi:hypothetical protein [Actinophytocola glycyrrhizae]|uniref:Repeat protein (TIGR01451 family) n=1 Tax=Actinophytocola glycyrrhizae TaxID=2044873 RepID=A0ABV9S007_9PSEU
MSRYATAVLLALIVTVPFLGLGADQPGAAPPAERVAEPSLLPPPPSPELEPSYRDAVYGDFLLAGNSVLRCPVDGETAGDHSPQECAAATSGADTGGGLLDNRSNNNGYYLHHADVDDLPETFDASTATVTVPQGATVRHARLTWGGHTGRFIGFSGINCVRPLLLQGEAPPPPAMAAPADQPVTVSVGGREPVTVSHSGFHTTDGLTEASQVYTAWADVTQAFTDVQAGAPVPVTVGNVWVPTGPGCAGGWSVTVVFDHGQPTAEYPRPRVVDIYHDDLPRSGVLLPGLIEPLLPGVPLLDGVLPGLVPALTGSRVLLPGLTPHRSAADVAIGVTAFDGDWRQGEETMTVDGEPVVEPCSADGAADFFRSCALGAADPLVPGAEPVNNLGVDAKTVRPALADNDTGAVEVGLDAVSDFVVLGNLVLSSAIDPSIAMTMTGPAEPVAEGSLATFDVVLTNDGGLPLTGLTLRVGAPEDGTRCVPGVLPALEPGASTTATCVRPVTEQAAFDLPAEVTASYLAVADGAARTVTARSTARVEVVPADLSVTRMPDRLVTRAGATVEFAVRLRNNTAAPVHDLVYTDSAAPDCTAPGATLDAATTMAFTCTVTAPGEAFESGGTLRGTTADGSVVTVESDRVTVNVIAPAVTVGTVAEPDTIYRGGTTELTFTVTNPGTDPDEALTDVIVTAADLCAAEPVATLAPGESATTSCTAAPTETRGITATAAAFDVTGEAVTGTADEVAVTVLEPLIALRQETDRTVVRVGEEVVLTFTVEHTGTEADGPVRDVRVTSPTLPPDCLPDPVAELAPGESASVSCRAAPDRTFDNQAFAAALDRLDRVMRVGTAPARVVVINPAMTISTTAEPETAKHGAPVDFAVTVRNIGDVPLTVAVTNDNAPDCDFTLAGEGLRAGAANGVRCTVTAPSDEGTTELTNTAAYRAEPLPGSGDTGPPLDGADDATVRLAAGQAEAPPAPGDDPLDPAGGGGVEGGTTGGDADPARREGAGAGLAWTGASIAGYVVGGVALLVVGGLVLLVTSRRRHDPDSALYRWWPGS